MNNVEISINDNDNEELEKPSYYKKVLDYLLPYINEPDYYNTLFKVIFGNSMILLIIVLFCDIYDYNIIFKNRMPINNWMFQLANIFLFLSYTSNNILYLRIVLSCGGLWFMLWAIYFEAGVLADTMMWNYVMTLINVRQAIAIFYAKRPIVFDEDREQIYNEKFKGIMTRVNFKILCQNSFIREIQRDRYYAQYGDTCNNLSILISGKIKIVKKEREESIVSNNNNQVILYQDKDIYVWPNEFIDSPEWVMRKSRRKYAVSMFVEEKCKFLMWPYEILEEVLGNNPQLSAPLSGVLGSDVSMKIFKS